MTSGTNEPDPVKGRKQNGSGKDAPDWANGLRQLYDAVVDEPLPDSFKDLLAQLDESEEGDSKDAR